MDSIDMVSIVVPVYKAESTIRRCVDSILAQTYCNFELILVDDGSPDNSGTICDEYAQSDIRVKVFHKENGGVSSARNLGIDNASGKYLVFVDSDDYVTPNYLFNMLQMELSQLVIGGIVRCVDGKNEEMFVCENWHMVIGEDLIKAFSKENPLIVYCFPTSKLFLMEIIESFQIRFDTNLFFLEDFSFVLDYMAKVESVDLLNVTDYVYCITKEETNRGKKYKMNAEQLMIHYEAVDTRIKILEASCGKSLEDIRHNVNRRLLRNLKFYLNTLSDKTTLINQIDQLNKWAYKKDFLSSALRGAGRRNRVKYTLLFQFPLCFGIRRFFI